MIEIVGKIGSMALIDEKHKDIDYNKFAMIGHWLRPGIVWVTSGAVEIGRLDYVRRHGKEATSATADELKTDYSAEGQAILMETYRRFVNPNYSLRQVLVEHDHFNNEVSRSHILSMLRRAVTQGAIPVINYNDAVAVEELRKTEIATLEAEGKSHVELVDNDETAAQTALLTGAKTLLILTKLDGVYRDINDPGSLITEITGTKEEVLNKIEEYKKGCHGASRKGANGAFAKLEYIKPCIKAGIEVIIGSSNHDIRKVLSGESPRTYIKGV
ncbi:MAG: uridylate kinase [Clostridia bacterium]|nr:uridylate kinase [Clostridia bacterium]